MTKSDLIETLARQNKMSIASAEELVNCVFETMADTLVSGEGIEIRGFGSFTLRDYKPYTGHNPRTGETVQVAAKRLPFFKVGKELKELVNGTDDLDER